MGVPARTLATGARMPLLGLGVWQTPPGRVTEQAVTWALETGYRHVDTARLYRNEESVGRAVAASAIPREELFLATKLHPRTKGVRRAIEESLRLLGVDYLDLYLIHWPTGLVGSQWRVLEQAHDEGLARAIGVSNFDADLLRHVARESTVAPHVNQVQFSPFTFREGLLAACADLGCVLEAYSPLTQGRRLSDPTVTAIAGAHGRTPAQVLLRWCVQRDIPVIPKSTRRERIEENAAIFDFELTPADVAALDALDTTGRADSAR